MSTIMVGLIKLDYAILFKGSSIYNLIIQVSTAKYKAVQAKGHMNDQLEWSKKV